MFVERYKIRVFSELMLHETSKLRFEALCPVVVLLPFYLVNHIIVNNDSYLGITTQLPWQWVWRISLKRSRWYPVVTAVGRIG